MLEVSYQNDDPGIVYNTLLLLNEEFRKQYQTLRFGETSNVIKYFEEELSKKRDTLSFLETDLKEYNIEHGVINYDEQTKHIAALSRDFELNNEAILLEEKSAETLCALIEARIDELTTFKNNAAFVEKLENISKLQARLASAEVLSAEDPAETTPQVNLAELRRRLAEQTQSLYQLTSTISASQYTK
ncbi:MAG: exopolysaccharide biosynthesis protein, partial [Alistipes sp.]